jgi:glyoxylase-like metal-dependent hydrolase (beta-lactamase superfamily II)
LPEPDYRYYGPDGQGFERAAAQFIFSDSIAPIEAAGHLVLWSGDFQVSDSLRLRPAPGHTPGSSVVWLMEAAVFTGDLMHSPMEILRPSDPCAFDVDAVEASASRRRVLAEAAGSRALVVPAHFPGHGAATVAAARTGFDIDEWVELSPI